MRTAVAATFALCAIVLAAYAATYAWARGTHRLVHYAGGAIARPHATHGIGSSTWELAFLPAIWLEETCRRPLAR